MAWGLLHDHARSEHLDQGGRLPAGQWRRRGSQPFDSFPASEHVSLVIGGFQANRQRKFVNQARETNPHYSRGFLTKPPRRQARRARGAARRGVATPGGSEGGVPPSWGFYKGAGPPCRSGRGRLQSRARDGREAYLKQYVDRPRDEPARRQACRSGVSAVAVEAFVNDAG